MSLVSRHTGMPTHIWVKCILNALTTSHSQIWITYRVIFWMKHWPLFPQIQYLVHWIPSHSVVSAVTVQFPAETRQHSIHQSIQTGCGSHPASIKWVARTFSPGVKHTCLEAHHSAPHSATFIRRDQEWRYDCTHSHLNTPATLPTETRRLSGPQSSYFLDWIKKNLCLCQESKPTFPSHPACS